MERTKRNKPDHPTVLTCDPSFTAWGWVVMSGDTILSAGCIKTAPEAKKRRIREGDDRVRRTSEIIKVLLSLIEKYDIQFIVCELPHGSQNAKAAVMIGIVVGVVQAISDSLDIPVEWFSENDAKKNLLGKISASKSEVIDAIDTHYEVPWSNTKYIDEAVADALAIYYVARATSPTLKILMR